MSVNIIERDGGETDSASGLTGKLNEKTVRSDAMADIPVVIFAGGKGTRLRPFTACLPKPLVPIGDMPILEVVLRQLADHGFQNVTLSLGHMSELIRAYTSTTAWNNIGLDISTVDEEAPSGTAGSLARVPGLDGTFMAMNGDVLTNLDYGALVQSHMDSGALLTIAAHNKELRIDLGVLEADAQGRLTGYIEKPIQNYKVSMGVYVYSSEVLNFIEKDKYLDFPTLVQQMIARGEHVNIYQNEAFWLDIGRPEDYAQAQDIFERDPELFGIGRRGE